MLKNKHQKDQHQNEKNVSRLRKIKLLPDYRDDELQSTDSSSELK
jgi:hypothetical protein